MGQPVLGILTLYLNDNGLLEEKQVYQKMTAAGRRIGLEVFVFTPQDVNYKQNRIFAHIFDASKKTWTRKWRSFPHMIYDRCRIQRGHRFEQLGKFRKQYGHLTFLNRVLRNKWTVYRTMRKEEPYRPHLPLTRLYEGQSDLSEMIKKYPLIYLKPINGTGGRGILRIEKQKGGTYLIQGRDQSRRIISPQRVPLAGLHGRLAGWNLKGNRYLVQQGIQLKLPNGRVHDYRMLVQKNGSGAWEVTGCAGRIGASGSITSNLHGGGQAITMSKLLRQWIASEDTVLKVTAKAEELGVQIAAFLEESYGRLCELALDLAIDRKGQIWLLEVNPKPAREVFLQAGERDTYRHAITRPLEYAMWLYEQKKRRKEKSAVPSATNPGT
ncbi:YheC/YheD family endospore coat-associated protein [Paenibacillus nasutitermitis]|uniref:Endospore coat-associated protein YheC n=1 Tax=Paenibacillus nasutitermitis TaxID=1652958 RepID=A0A917DWW6_9BACL|nr:YheC/YheD family protein [Paenibacillus nasutitermitis]GGD74242.1 endospore coat-associated protein YheC [Paenibacillus nasutitermitis]